MKKAGPGKAGECSDTPPEQSRMMPECSDMKNERSGMTSEYQFFILWADFDKNR